MAEEKKGFVAGLKSRLMGSKTEGDDGEDGEKKESSGFMKTGINMLTKMSNIAHGDDGGDGDDDVDTYVKREEVMIVVGEPEEAKKWTDAEYELDKKMPEMWRDFQQPRDWWLSAEEALPILAAERNQIREDGGGRPNFVTAGLLATNRFLAEQVLRYSTSTNLPPGHADCSTRMRIIPARWPPSTWPSAPSDGHRVGSRGNINPKPSTLNTWGRRSKTLQSRTRRSRPSSATGLTRFCMCSPRTRSACSTTRFVSLDSGVPHWLENAPP